MNSNNFNVKEDSFTKTDDDSSLSDGVDTYKNKAQAVSHFNFENVRFTPKVIEFVDAFEGKHFAVKITIQNVGRNPVSVKLGEPNSFIFQIKKPSRKSKILAAGTSITKTITYTYRNVDLIKKSQIPVQINGHYVDYPIVVKRAVADIEIQPQKLDFEIINVGASAKTLVLTIINKGGKRTKFKVDVGKNVLDLVVTPMRGTIKAKNQVNVLVEMMGIREGEYYHEIWIKTNEMPIRVPVLVKVVRPRIEIVYPNGTEDFTLINFQPTFNGTQRAHSFILKNCSTDTTLFNTLAEVNGKLEILKDARNSTHAFSMFILSTEEGRLEPFEKKILTVLFRPKAKVLEKSWHHKHEETKQTETEHIVFLRINRVHRIERKANPDADTIAKPATTERHGTLLRAQSTMTGAHPIQMNSAFDFSEKEGESSDRSIFFTESFLPEEKVLRLCLHGNAVEPDILIQPVSFEYSDLNLGQTENKVLRLTNNSSIPVLCRIRKALNIIVTPQEIWLGKEKSHEFFVSLTPKCAGVFKTKMKIQFLAKSDVVYDYDEPLETVAVRTVIFTYKARDVCLKPVPKAGLGITPLLIDDVGYQKELITYKDAFKLPSAAVLSLKHGFRTKWMTKEKDKLNNVDNAIVALPNDRPHLYYTWPKDKICRTIFGGFFRYAPPEDLQYTLSDDDRKKKNEHKRIWIDYLTLLKELRKKNYPNPDELKKCWEYEISCKKHYKLEQIKLSNITDSSILNIKEIKKCFKVCEEKPEYTFVPLSPSLLSNVVVEPKFINYDKVAVSTVAEKSISIINKNNFPISIKFVSGKSTVSVMEEDTITIQSSATKLIKVIFRSKDLGQYFGFLNYVINGSHDFKISISAFVTPKTIILGNGLKTVEFGCQNPKEAFQPMSVFLPMENLFQVPVKYRWVVSQDSAFNINILDGEIPPKSTLLSEVLFNICPMKSFYSEMNLISESGISEFIKFVQPSKKVPVNFVSNRIDMHDVPLNLPTKVYAVIQSACYHDVPFEVLESNPLPGISIEPKYGLIKPRSYFPLEIVIQIPVIMKFNFSVVLLVHFANKISVKVTGNVVTPLIRMKPSEVVLRKICARSIDNFAICVENVGTTPAEVAVNFKNCPEYKVADGNDTLYLKPKQCSKFLIQFEPSDVARHMFYLPVKVNRILGPPEMQEPDTEYIHFYTEKNESMYEEFGQVSSSRNLNLKIPCVCLNSTVSQSLLTISPPNITFKEEPKARTRFQSREITFINDSDDVLTFCIRNDDLGECNESPFDLIPVEPDSVEKRLKSLKVQLKTGELLVMKATFVPKKPGFYSIDVPVFVRGYSNGLVYNFIRLRGQLMSPRIFSDVSEIHFPPLPLDVGCDVAVNIYAENYRAPDTLKCLVCNPGDENIESDENYLKTKWLTEPHVSHCEQKYDFQLLVTFRSEAPVAVKNYILILDSSGAYMSLFVSAIADNSVLTTHAFLATRSTKYRLIRDSPPPVWKTDDLLNFPIDKSAIKQTDKNIKRKKNTSKMSVSNSEMYFNSNVCTFQVDKGPRLVIQETKSMTRSTQLDFINVPKQLDNRGGSSTALTTGKSRILNSCKYNFISKSESTFGSRIGLNAQLIGLRRTDLTNDVTYPNFPMYESVYKKHFESTLKYTERWMFEVVMRCSQYFSIPISFQTINSSKNQQKSSSKSKEKNETPEMAAQKDFLDFLQEVIGKNIPLPKRLSFTSDQSNLKNKAIKIRSVFAEILEFLESKGCFLPHVKPEYLMEYENYAIYMEVVKNIETFSWSYELQKGNSLKHLHELKSKTDKDLRDSSSTLSVRDFWTKSLFDEFKDVSETELDKTEDKNPEPIDILEPLKELVEGKKFEFNVEILDNVNFNQRSTQAWFDIVVQVFRTFVLKNVILKNTIPRVSVIEASEKIPSVPIDLRTVCVEHAQSESTDAHNALINNVYTVQERILMDWVNRHCQMQEKILWSNKNCKKGSNSCFKVINNFDKDLSDSVALISVTASHCPYIVSSFFRDVFREPDTPNELYHNAGRLIQAWRALEIGLTVETSDIVQPNPFFMVMLVMQLYEVLPPMHPNYLICFSTPLNSELKRTIQLKNDFQQRIYYKVKFFGEFEEFFSTNNSPLIELKASGVTEVQVTYKARKIKKTSATLLLCGSSVSPDFAKHLAFYLEGEPSGLPEYNKQSLSAPLYKVVCFALPIQSPYPEPTTYEIWYTTKQPEYLEFVDIETMIKPWSKIWNRKISRRLFLNKSEIVIVNPGEETTLSVTVACFTEQIRLFWLLFRSDVGDFIVLIEIKPKLAQTETALTAFYSESWSPSATCICSDGKELPRPSSINANSCPCLTELKIPSRNEVLWSALWSMFLKTLQPHEKSFWSEHFEMDIGVSLILWLLSPDEEEEVIDEFIQVLPTKLTYSLNVEAPNDAFIIIPPKIEILDVRKKSEITVPIHISNMAPSNLKFTLTMVSENGKEIRTHSVEIIPCSSSEETDVVTTSSFIPTPKLCTC